MHDLKIRFQIHDVLFCILLVLSFLFTRNIACSMMMVAFFGYTVMRQISKRKKIEFPFLCVGYVCFILYGVLNVVFDNVMDSDVSSTMNRSLLLNFMMIYAIVQYIAMQQKIVNILHITEFSIFIVAMVVIILSLETITQGRLGSDSTINGNVLSMLCVYGFVLTLYLRKVDKFSLGICGMKLVFYTLAILLSGSRKGLIMIVLAILIINFLFGRRKLVRNMLATIIILGTGYILVMKVEVLYNIIGVRVESLITLLTEGTTADGSLKSRQQLIDTGLYYIKQKPWTGYGYDCFKLISGIGGRGKVSSGEFGYYSHNNYIELLFSGGIIGFGLYYAPMVQLLQSLLSNIKKNVCVPYLIAIFVSKLAVEYAYVSYYSRIDAYIIAVILGCFLVCKGETKEAT